MRSINILIFFFIIFEVQGIIPIWLNMTFNPSKPTWENPAIDTPHKETPQEYYDFIIIGSGSAGSVIANRLSENPVWRVLLLEIGKPPNIWTEMPAITPYFLFTDYNWGYLAEKQENMGLGFINQQIRWPRGKVLGGTSVIDGMIFSRGNKLDYDLWNTKGNTGWSYQEVLPYFKKFEDYLVKKQDQNYHQAGGPIKIEDIRYKSKSGAIFIEAMQEKGYEYLDYNGKKQIGVSYVHTTTNFGRRSSAHNAFIEPILKRQNLKVLSEARVIKILIDKETKRAFGVKYVKDRQNHIALASKEIILSAGALNSPQLLILSGIGPKNHLKQLGIDLIQNLPVGRTLYDRLGFLGLVIEVNDTITIPCDDMLYNLSHLHDYKFGKGLLTISQGLQAIAMIKSNVTRNFPQHADLELLFFGCGFHSDEGEICRRGYGISDETYDAIWKPLHGKQAVQIVPILNNPKSCGYLGLKSKNPYHWPKFFANYFTDRGNFDVKTLIEGVRFVQKLLKTSAFKKYNAKLAKINLVGCQNFKYDSDGFWECALRHLSTSVHDQVGTCKMGPVYDNEAVVNPELLVYGVKGLRVADTSVVPISIAGHTGAVSYMIGFENQSIRCHRGRVLGGSSELNFMIMSRSANQDYDNWVTTVGRTEKYFPISKIWKILQSRDWIELIEVIRDPSTEKTRIVLQLDMPTCQQLKMPDMITWIIMEEEIWGCHLCQQLHNGV